MTLDDAQRAEIARVVAEAERVARDERRAAKERRRVTRGGRRKTDKVQCPDCGTWESEVVTCRPDPRGQGFQRMRGCLNKACGSRYWTIERIDKKVRGYGKAQDVGEQLRKGHSTL